MIFESKKYIKFIIKDQLKTHKIFLLNNTTSHFVRNMANLKLNFEWREKREETIFLRIINGWLKYEIRVCMNDDCKNIKKSMLRAKKMQFQNSIHSFFSAFLSHMKWWLKRIMTLQKKFLHLILREWRWMMMLTTDNNVWWWCQWRMMRLAETTSSHTFQKRKLNKKKFFSFNIWIVFFFFT